MNTIEPLESRIAPAAASFYHDLASDLKTKLDAIQSIVDGAVGAGTLIPVVGDQIASAGKVIDSFSNKLRDAIDAISPSAIDDDVRTAIFDLLRPDATNAVPALRLLAENNGDNAVTKDDVIITHPDARGDSVLIDMSLHAMVGVSTSLAFDVGLGALPIRVESNAGVQVGAVLDYHHLTFGLSETSGFLFQATTPNELTVGFTAGLTPGSTLTATIGFLRGTIADGAFDDPNLHTKLTAGLTIDLTDAGVGAVDFDASADVALKLDAGFGENFPSIGADFRMHYAGLKASDAAPTVDFKNVRVNLGSAISGVLEPVVDVIGKVLAPVQPVVDFITAPIPVLSDLSHGIGAGDITLLGIAGVVAGQAPEEYKELFQLASTITQVLKFAEDFKADPDAGSVSIVLGDFNVQDGNDASADLRGVAHALDLTTTASGTALSSLVPAGFLGNFDIAAKIDDAVAGTPLEGSPIIGELKDTIDQFIHPNGITYSFPFLSDPAGAVFGMLLGRDADLFTLDAKLKVKSDFGVSLPVPIGIDVSLGGSASADLQLHMGYDTFGLREFAKDAITNGVQPATFLDFLDGFYFTDKTHAYLDASIAASAGVDVVVASVEVEGGVSLAVHIDPPTNLNEMDGDVHKIHRPELTDCLFETNGSLDAFLDVFAKVGIGPLSISKHFDIAHVTLLDFSGGCIPNPFTPPLDLHLASTHADDASLPPGTLRLNVGTHASDRGVSENVASENYQVFIGGDPQTIVVLAFGYVQEFKGITQIIADAGDGNDVIVFQSTSGDAPFTASVDVTGGDGNDQILYHGIGAATLRGGAGNDVLAGGDGANHINGGEGDDHLSGGASANVLGAFTLNGSLLGEAGDDTITGGTGMNTIDGGDGNDALFAGASDGDKLTGGAGADVLVAGAGRASFLGGTGDDEILWRAGDGRPLLVDGGNDRENNSLEMTGGDFADTFTLSKNAADSRLLVALTNPAQGFNFLAKSIQNVLIEGGAGADVLSVNSLSGTVVHNVGLNLSDVLKDTLHVGDGVTDVITVNGRAVADTTQIAAEQVVINDQVHGSPIFGGVMKVSGLPSYIVRLANVADDFTYNAGAGANVTTLLSDTGPTRLLGGAGDDKFTIAAHAPGDYLAPVKVNAGAGKNAITFDESTSTIGDTIILGPSQYASMLVPAVKFTGSFGGGVGVKCGGFADTVNIGALIPAVKTSVATGAGDDTVNVGANASGTGGSLNAIAGPLSIDAGAGANVMKLVDSNDANGNAAVTITADKVLGLAGAADTVTIAFKATAGALALTIDGSDNAADVFTLTAPQAALTIRGGGGSDVVKASALVAPLTFQGGAGDDALTLGAGTHKLGAFNVSTSFQGGTGTDTLTLDDAASASARTFNVSSAAIAFGGVSLAIFDASVEMTNLLGGSGADAFDVNAVPLTGLSLDGGAGANKLSGPFATNVWSIAAVNAGTLNTTVKFKNVPSLTGGAGADRFVLANAKGLTGAIDGGAGSDTLDYSAYTGAVTVNLAKHTATNVLGGIAACENATGGSGADVLVGDELANVLAGNAGRDVIIGGLGADTITGGADEDILIGGTTDHDTLPAALAAIAKEWSTPATYLARIAHLKSGGGFNGATLLNSATVHDDMVADTLTGGVGTGDWFFARLTPGGADLTDLSPSTEQNG